MEPWGGRFSLAAFPASAAQEKRGLLVRGLSHRAPLGPGSAKEEGGGWRVREGGPEDREMGCLIATGKILQDHSHWEICCTSEQPATFSGPGGSGDRIDACSSLSRE